MRRALALAVLAAVGCTDAWADRMRTRTRARSGRTPITAAAGTPWTNTTSIQTDGAGNIQCTGAGIGAAAAATFSWWVRADGAWPQGPSGFTMWSSQPTGSDISWDFRSSSTADNFTAYIATHASDVGTYFSSSGAGITGSGNWHLIVVVFDGSQGTADDRLLVYVDTVLLTGTYTGTMPTTLRASTSNRIEIAVVRDTLIEWPAGNLDEMYIWLTAATASQRTELWNSGTPGDVSATTLGTPLHGFRFEPPDGDSSTVADVGSGGATCVDVLFDASDYVTEIPP